MSYFSNFNSQLLPAEAIREVRARGCTMPDVAELIVQRFGAVYVLANLDKVQAMGDELAKQDSDEGKALRELFANAAGTQNMSGDAIPEIPAPIEIAEESKVQEPAATPEESAPAPTEPAASAAVGTTSGEPTASAAQTSGEGESALPGANG